MMKSISCSSRQALAIAALSLVLAVPTSAGVLNGTVTNDEGQAMEGVMVRVTDDIAGISETV